MAAEKAEGAEGAEWQQVMGGKTAWTECAECRWEDRMDCGGFGTLILKK